ncbi:MAG TPA: Ppx/GppA phosphatase family protein [Candidatus Acidoferrum sp.]|nr:Ppx/GppA phosphatase family protein [Candidatus Acidoferrum sp.]
MRVAVIDLGSNTIRLLVGEADGAGGYLPVFADQEITRLGEGLLPGGQLQAEPMRRSLSVLRRFRELAASQGAIAMAAVGTSALREAVNRQVFLDLAWREAGFCVRVVSGEEEARLTLRGVLAALGIPSEHLLMLDIGGGSTELLLAHGREIRAVVSTNLGVVRLTEAHLKHDPPLAEELGAIRAVVSGRIASLRTRELPARTPGEILVGTAGTVTTLAAIDLSLDPYDSARVTGHCLSRERIADLLENLARLPLQERRRVPGLEPGRADVIVAGTIVCLGVMDGLGFADLTVSDGGLREGILLDFLERVAGQPPGRHCTET